MPQASEDVRKPWNYKNALRYIGNTKSHQNFFGWAWICVGDALALQYLLKHGFTERNGMIYPPRGKERIAPKAWRKKFYRSNKKEWSAIVYLCDEWDYAYAGDRYWIKTNSQ